MNRQADASYTEAERRTGQQTDLTKAQRLINWQADRPYLTHVYRLTNRQADRRYTCIQTDEQTDLKYAYRVTNRQVDTPYKRIQTDEQASRQTLHTHTD